jgi:hypothetical protein
MPSHHKIHQDSDPSRMSTISNKISSFFFPLICLQMTIKINFYHVALTMDCHLPASNTFLVCFSSANSLAFWVFDEHRRMQIGVEKGFHLAHWTSQYLPLNRACTPVGTSVIPGYRVCVLGVGTSATPKSVHSIFAAKCVKDWWLNLTYSEEEVGGGWNIKRK